MESVICTAFLFTGIQVGVENGSSVKSDSHAAVLRVLLYQMPQPIQYAGDIYG